MRNIFQFCLFINCLVNNRGPDNQGPPVLHMAPSKPYPISWYITSMDTDTSFSMNSKSWLAPFNLKKVIVMIIIISFRYYKTAWWCQYYFPLPNSVFMYFSLVVLVSIWIFFMYKENWAMIWANEQLVM